MGKLVQRVSASLFDLAMAPLERWRLSRLRRTLMSQARGTVLELGAGTGANVPHYRSSQLSFLTLSDLDDRRLVLADRMQRWHPQLKDRWRVEQGSAEVLPYPDDSFDTVVATLLFCSVDCPPCGFDEIARVLRPGGRYLFLEHVRPEPAGMARLFDVINPLWNGFSRGCNLNRDTVAAIRRGGLTIDQLHRDRNGVFVWGVARA